jgi:hypothetical protein
MLVPELEYEEGPEGFAVIVRAGLVFGEKLSDRLGAEEALAAKAFGREEILGEGFQRAAEPTCDGDTEALLTPTECFARELGTRSAFEDVLEGTAAELVARGQRLSEIDQVVIQHGSPDFERGGHGGSVDLREDIFREVGVLVEQ